MFSLLNNLTQMVSCHNCCWLFFCIKECSDRAWEVLNVRLLFIPMGRFKVEKACLILGEEMEDTKLMSQCMETTQYTHKTSVIHCVGNF